MADYWKSQAKKYCDFCKCWIADNKPSIGFHESGKKHKENVTRRISEIRKNSAKSYEEELQVDQDMKKMEEEAIKAYMKDLQENPDYTSKKILEDTEKRKIELEKLVNQQNTEELNPVEQKSKEKDEENSTTKVWYEAKSDEGYTYYWNINTAESVWEPPEEGYMSLEEQKKKQEDEEKKKELKRLKKEEKEKSKGEEVKEFKEKETKSKKRKKAKVEESGETCSAIGPVPKSEPYGSWTVVEPKIEEPVDLELPQQEYVAIKVPELVEPEVKFKEKTISSLEEDPLYGAFKKEIEECSTNFKKRKVNRGNMRQKLDTE